MLSCNELNYNARKIFPKPFIIFEYTRPILLNVSSYRSTVYIIINYYIIHLY